jgi:hypothetical protein
MRLLMPALTLTRLYGHYPVFAAFKLPFRTVEHGRRSDAAALIIRLLVEAKLSIDYSAHFCRPSGTTSGQRLFPRRRQASGAQ